MAKKRITVIREYGVLSCEGKPSHIENEKAIPEKSFNNLWDFILANTNDDLDKVMSIHTKRGVKYIKASKYVGTIQTSDGHIIEILPKVYKSGIEEEENIQLCRKVFLRMLSTYQNAESKSFQSASLNTKSNFPILERYISSYLNEVSYLIQIGLKKNYVDVKENLNFLKGKLIFSQNITKNCANKAKFFVQYSKYIENIPQNRIIVTTLNKLSAISKDSKNITQAHMLLTMLGDIPPSDNITRDLQLSLNTNRLFESYTNIIHWSEQFLLNKGFTAFSGSHVNISLLFSAERLFEYFVAHLFKRYAKEYNVKSQSSKYFLVDRQEDRDKGRFSLRPDIVIGNKATKDNAPFDSIIIDTKWKNIDSSVPEKNYLIDIKDMYQLYAYGKKYEQGENFFLEAIPKLVLIYPCTEKFNKQLPAFEYEEIKEKYGLELIVMPFDLADEGVNGAGYKKQIENIINSVNTHSSSYSASSSKGGFGKVTNKRVHDNNTTAKEKSLLFAFYEDDNDLRVIEDKRQYSKETELVNIQIPSKIVLCHKDNINERHIYNVNQSQIKFSKSSKGKDIITYSLDNEIKKLNKLNINSIINTHIEKKGYDPFFINY